MTSLAVPSVYSYFVIYTLEDSGQGGAYGMNWDLHATATDRTLAISHARMLAMQPDVKEVHVKHVTENPISGIISVRDVKRCGRAVSGWRVREMALPLLTAAFVISGLIALLF